MSDTKKDKVVEEVEVKEVVEELPFLTLNQIELMQDIKTKAISPPNWGGRIMIKGLTLGQYSMCQQAPEELQAGLAAAFGIVDPETLVPLVKLKGEDAFADLMSTKSTESMGFIFRAITALSEGVEKPKGKKN